MTGSPSVRSIRRALCLAALLPWFVLGASAQQDPNAPAPTEPPAEAPATPADPNVLPPLPPAAPTPTAPATTPKLTPPPPAPEPAEPAKEAKLPSKLAKHCERLRSSDAARDPIGVRYLDLVESGAATAQDYSDFGVFLARRYYLGAAEDFISAATDIDSKNIEFWLNLGTVRLQFGKLSSALVAYEKARKIDANNAQAHYGIAVVHDYMRNYDQAVDSYVHALALDPSLGDPTKNPQAANNERLTVVKLLLYQASGGSLALPLSGGPADDPKKPKPAAPANGNGKKS